jgi:tRNA(Ile)-lysidine synthase
VSPHGQTTRILASVRLYARRHDLLRPGALVVAVSGGTDSTALALILAELREELGLVLHVAHFDHRARPRAAAADAAFVADLANHIGATVRVGRADATPKSEDDARRARYAFLRRVAQELGATAIATGHTQDDQAETVLLHLARGSGIDGLAGMRPERDGIVRPLLSIARADTIAVARAARVKPREDPTNRALRFARNRVRHRIVPELRKLNPGVAGAIARLADAAADIADLSRQRAESAIAAADDGSRLDLDRLPGDQREHALATWWERRTGRRLTSRHRDALAALATDRRGSKSLDLPGGRALREYGHLSIAVETPQHADGAITLSSGETAAWHGWQFRLDPRESDPLADRALLSAESAGGIVVRARRAGDRMDGRNGSKVQDVFTNAKVPARARDTWPLVTVLGKVIWIPGLTEPPSDGDVALEVHRNVEDRTKSPRR